MVAEKVTVINYGFKTPSDISKMLARSIGVQKTNESVLKLIILGILAGVYIGFGAVFATLVSSDAAKYVGVGLAKVITGAVFSVGLMLVVIAGAELFTGNNLMLKSVLDKKVKFGKMLGRWGIVYFANFIGSLLLAYIIYKTDLWKGGNFLTGIQALKIANAKVNLSFSAAFYRAICCNWLVCLAVWQALASRNIIGRIFGIFFPIMTFVACGFEHCVANMYFIPAGMFLKNTAAATTAGLNLANLNLSGFIGNLIPVTLGNIIGGAVFVGMAYWYIYVKGTPHIEE